MTAACVAWLHGAHPARAADPPLTFQKPRFTREQMEATLATPGERWLIVYGTGDPAMTAPLRERAYAVSRRLFGGDSLAVVADVAADAQLVAARSLVLLGGPRQNSWTAKLGAALPVQFVGRGFRWVDRDYDRPGDFLRLIYPHPLEPRRLLVLIAPNSAAALAAGGSGGLLGGDDWRIDRDGERVRSGSFVQGAAHPWSYDPAGDRDREAERERFQAALVRTSGAGVRVAAPRGAANVARTVGRAEALVHALAVRGFGPPGAGKRTGRAAAGTGTPVTLVLYPSLEAKTSLTRVPRAEHVSDDGIAHVALPQGHELEDLWSVAGVVLQRGGASADSRFFVPAAVWLDGRYGGETLARAVSRLYLGRELPAAREAATDDSLWRSPLVWVPARALLVASVYAAAGSGGRSAVMRMLGRDVPPEFDAVCRVAGVAPARVAQRYLDLADSLSRAARLEPAPARAPRVWRPADGFQRGVCFAHAVGTDRGYGSAAAGRELADLAALGANWVSLSPYAFLPALDAPEIHPSAQGGPDEETDEAVCEAAAQARARGLRVWLVPQLWTRGWVGDMEFAPGGWSRFFEQYRRLITHYALLAEREGIDGLAVGHELPSATLRFAPRWRALIGEVRRLYSGTLTYDANWDREAGTIEFWDALDVIGVSFYAPLAARPSRDPAVLADGARRALAPLRAVGARFGKPVLLLEAGYAATAMAPVTPWAEDRAQADPETQRACHEALVAALEPEDWVAGVLVWKWFSDSRLGGIHDAGFTPQGKPARQTIANAWHAWQGRPVRVPQPAPKKH